jgi:hypothetical protein
MACGRSNVTDRCTHREGCEVNEQRPLPYSTAARSELSCVASTIALLARRQTHLRREHVGVQLAFANGTHTRVYRETVVDHVPNTPCILIVQFRLHAVRSWGHTLFRWESLLNTPLFVGFPGFVSKLWCAHDEHGVYRGLYEWDGPEQAEHYARSLWRVLALVSLPSSIRYIVLPDLRRDALLQNPRVLESTTAGEPPVWWRLVSVD